MNIIGTFFQIPALNQRKKRRQFTWRVFDFTQVSREKSLCWSRQVPVCSLVLFLRSDVIYTCESVTLKQRKRNRSRLIHLSWRAAVCLCHCANLQYCTIGQRSHDGLSGIIWKFERFECIVKQSMRMLLISKIPILNTNRVSKFYNRFQNIDHLEYGKVSKTILSK